MPVSKNGTLYFTDEQKEIADRNSSALDYAMSQGYDLVKQGSYYVMRQHDSMVFTPEGFWHWNSRGMHGRATEFIMGYEGRSFVEAVLILAGEGIPAHPQVYEPPPAIHRDDPPVPEFKLFPESDSNRQMFAYLCKTRALHPGIVKEMIRQKVLYQCDYVTKEGIRTNIHNACFVSYNNQGEPCSAFNRGLATVGEPYKGEIPGGDKSFGWVLHGKNPTKLYVFEAAIDAASFVSLGENLRKQPLMQADYLALGGLIFDPIENYLETHPQVQTVHLMLDNDHAGRDAAARFLTRLEEMGISVEDHVPPAGKDWNEYLQITMTKDHSQEQRPPPTRPLTLQERRENARQQLAAAPPRSRKAPSQELER